MHSTSKRPPTSRGVEDGIINKLYTSVSSRSNGAVKINYQNFITAGYRRVSKFVKNQNWTYKEKTGQWVSNSNEKKRSPRVIVREEKKVKVFVNISVVRKCYDKM